MKPVDQRILRWAGTMFLPLVVLPLPAEELVFETAVRPILKAACFHCHGEGGEREGGLDLRLVRLMVAGGESGPVLVPGAPDKSLLWEKLATDEMPKGEKKLSSERKAVVRRWIEQGAQTARPEPENVEEARFTVEELAHWAFQPVSEVQTPASGHPIDAFVATRLGREELSLAERANRSTLIRRMSFGVTGLPPTPEEVEAFLTDGKEGALERVIDRLLASPQYGVRWGRHWLDAAGYAESDGDAVDDRRRDHAWRYRDYVIEAFNRNKPIDQFLVEQLAGDELIEGEVTVEGFRHLELLTATGFLRMAPDVTQRSNTLADRNTAVADALKVVSTSMLGLTVGCAQCHDHKYDPIGIDDYYRFRAIFDPVFPLDNWKQPGSRLVDMTSAEVNEERASIEEEAKKEEDAMKERRRSHCAEILEKKLADVPESDREETRQAVFTGEEKRTQRQKDLLEAYPMVKPVNFISGLLVEYDNGAHQRFEKEKEKVTAIRTRKPPLRMIMATTEPDGDLPVSRIFFRGNPESAREVVGPAELMVIQRGMNELRIPGGDSAPAPREQASSSALSGSGVLPVSNGLQLHLDAGSFDAPDGIVKGWPDLSGNDRTAVATGQPQQFGKALNGRPAIRLDGKNDFLRTKSGAGHLAGDFTMVLVLQFNDLARHQMALMWGEESQGKRRAFWKAPSDKLSFNGYHADMVGSADLKRGVPVVAIITKRGQNNETRFRLNGRDGGGGGVSLSGFQNKAITIGANNGGGERTAADFAEVLVYDRALDANEQAAIGFYLGTKYGIDGEWAPHRSTGRRLAYARHLTGGSHPLTARVFVNRIWSHHFGRGLVATPGDFGIAGERPSHPELLDWLARDFMEHGWDLKRLHRMILLSRTYQQSSRRRVAHEQIDPENVLLGRANLRRLEAEAIRDALLAVSGKINLALGGVPSPVTANGEGKAVLGGDKTRRSAFVAVERRLPLNMLETFDQPVMTPNCNHRRQTTVATQALWFLNDAEVLGHADTLARALMKESGFSSVRLGKLYLRLFAEAPTPSELQDCEEYLASQREQFSKADPKSDAEHRALASLCQIMLASNRFLYVD